MAIFVGYADGGLNDSENNIKRSIGRYSSFYIKYYRLNPRLAYYNRYVSFRKAELGAAMSRGKFAF